MIGYVAKDKNGEIYLYSEKPFYNDEVEGWCSSPDMIAITGRFSEFDNISYTDKPVKVEINIKRI